MNNSEFSDWMAMPEVQERLKPIRELQMVLLEIMLAIKELCEKHDLKYYLYGGTLLGAIRHSGFIPWDDDLDVVMPRKDYERFLQIAEDELGCKYFVQSYRTERSYRHPFAKIRKNGTACIISDHAHIRMHHGIFVDIFPLENLPSCKIGRWAMWHIPYWFERLAAFSCARLPRRLKWMRFVQVLWKFVFAPGTFSKLSNLSCCLFGGKSDCYICVLDPIHKDPEYNIFKKDWFEPATSHSFEGVDLRVPGMAHAFLMHYYGDYMSLPPEDERIPLHSGVAISTTRDYTEFLNDGGLKGTDPRGAKRG